MANREIRRWLASSTKSGQKDRIERFLLVAAQTHTRPADSDNAETVLLGRLVVAASMREPDHP